ncbi:MAG: hypothetical protein AAF970_13495 [Bacteroidota bacterium]
MADVRVPGEVEHTEAQQGARSSRGHSYGDAGQRRRAFVQPITARRDVCHSL